MDRYCSFLASESRHVVLDLRDRAMPYDPSPFGKTPLKDSLSLGKGHSGLAHWRRQRITSIALIFLGLWFVGGVLPHVRYGYEAVAPLFASPGHGILLILLIVTSVYHGQLGLQVIIEDYIHKDFLKLFLILSVKVLALLIVGWGVLSVLTLYLRTF